MDAVELVNQARKLPVVIVGTGVGEAGAFGRRGGGPQLNKYCLLFCLLSSPPFFVAHKVVDIFALDCPGSQTREWPCPLIGSDRAARGALIFLLEKLVKHFSTNHSSQQSINIRYIPFEDNYIQSIRNVVPCFFASYVFLFFKIIKYLKKKCFFNKKVL